MSDEDVDLERLVEDRLLRVNALALGLVMGLLGGFALFLATTWLLLKDGSHPGAHLGLLSQYFVGYSVTPVGSVVGFAYAFVVCFAATCAGAWIYNRVTDLRHPRAGAGRDRG